MDSERRHAQMMAVARIAVVTSRALYELEADDETLASMGPNAEVATRVVFDLIEAKKTDEEIVEWLMNYQAAVGGVPVELLSGDEAVVVLEYTKELVDAR